MQTTYTNRLTNSDVSQSPPSLVQWAGFEALRISQSDVMRRPPFYFFPLLWSFCCRCSCWRFCLVATLDSGREKTDRTRKARSHGVWGEWTGQGKRGSDVSFVPIVLSAHGSVYCSALWERERERPEDRRETGTAVQNGSPPPSTTTSSSIWWRRERLYATGRWLGPGSAAWPRLGETTAKGNVNVTLYNLFTPPV